MQSAHTGPVVGLIGQATLLTALAATTGLTVLGWVVGTVCSVALTVLLARGLDRKPSHRLGPADQVTLARATVVVGLAALIADSFGQPAPLSTMVALSVTALILDGVDGWVARRTGTESALGARFDMEVDAFLILVLSIYVAHTTEAWVLAIGAARYGFVAAGWVLPWMRAALPPRYWRKVVAAIQGIVLTVALAAVLPRRVTEGLLLVALATLTESFGRDIWWLRRHRPAPAARRVVAPTTLTVGACLLVWLGLVVPNEVRLVTPGAFIRVPLEGFLIVALALVLKPRGRRLAAGVFGLALGLLVLVKALDMGFFLALDRPFDPLSDWSYFPSSVDLLADSIGRAEAIATVVAASLAAVAVLILLPWSVLRLAQKVHRHRPGSVRVALSLAAVWILLAVLGIQLVPGVPIASTNASHLAYAKLNQVSDDLQDRARFDAEISDDAFRSTPDADLLPGLRGKDVIVVFVESYGRVAVEESAGSRNVAQLLDAGTNRLQAAGFSSRSAYLTSPTFGGISWLAHSTLQSGLWIDNQARYDRLVSSQRLTLSSAFKRAGWRTVGVVPSNERDWPEGTSFYHYDAIYDERNVGYAGPSFSYAAMPDQYVLSAFRRLELAGPHPPVMAEIDLVSSHTPWAPLPSLVDWAAVGNGSVFEGMPDQGLSPEVVWRDPSRVQAAYMQSIEYSLNTLISFVENAQKDNLVLIVLGDHQPSSIVTGPGASHDVPVSIIAHDPVVFDQVSGWQWDAGLRPGPSAPVWPMDAFRDRFLSAFGSPESRAPSRAALAQP